MGGTPSPKIEAVKGSLARLIAREIAEYDSSSIITVFGRTGAGKSQYALKVSNQFYRDWGEVLRWVVFTPFDFHAAIEELDSRGEWVPVIVWDDAGPWLELLKRNSWHPLAVGIRGAFETARVRVGAVILTMTTDRSLPRSIAYDGYLYKFRAKMAKWGSDRGRSKSLARIQVRVERESEWGKFYWEERYRDWVTLNTPVYGEYLEIRKRYLALYNKLIRESRHLRPSKLLDYIAREWDAMKSY